LCGAVLVNIAPENPYIAKSVMVWQVGHFLSFNGTTRLASSLWPFIALAYLCWFGWLQWARRVAQSGSERL
jgi:hypothetical protein